MPLALVLAAARVNVAERDDSRAGVFEPVDVGGCTSARADAIKATASTAKRPNFLIFLLSYPSLRAIMIPNPSPLPQAEI